MTWSPWYHSTSGCGQPLASQSTVNPVELEKAAEACGSRIQTGPDSGRSFSFTASESGSEEPEKRPQESAEIEKPFVNAWRENSFQF